VAKTFTTPQALAADIKQFVARAAGQVMGSVTRAVIDATPVDTTHAKSNWVPSVGSPSDGVQGSKESPDTGAQSSGFGQLAGYRLEQGDIFTTNNVDYIGNLDGGSSSQAPAGFVDGAVRDGIAGAGTVPGGE
jgi:hypothetical protein